MEFNTAKVNFKLNTKSISESNTIGDYPLTNMVGSINQYRTSITWNTINIRNLLGELYNHYEIFNIQLVSAGYETGTTLYGATADDRAVQIVMSGLDWVYSNYNISTGNMTTETVMQGVIYEGQAVSSVGNIASLRCCTFRKCITTDITINLYTLLGTYPDMNIGTIFPQLSFTFLITPVQ